LDTIKYDLTKNLEKGKEGRQQTYNCELVERRQQCKKKKLNKEVNYIK
jgi:hypothetical protein